MRFFLRSHIFICLLVLGGIFFTTVSSGHCQNDILGQVVSVDREQSSFVVRLDKSMLKDDADSHVVTISTGAERLPPGIVPGKWVRVWPGDSTKKGDKVIIAERVIFSWNKNRIVDPTGVRSRLIRGMGRKGGKGMGRGGRMHGH